MKRFLTTIILFSEVASAKAFIRVRPHVVVTPGADVKLAQVVDASGVSAKFLQKLNSVSLSTAPALGEKQELSSLSISSVLRPLIQQEKLHHAGAIRVVIPQSVVIDTLNRNLTPDVVKAELLQGWSPLCSGCRLSVDQLSLPQIGHLRDWSLKLTADLPRGSFSVPVNLIKADGSPISAWISGRLVIKRKVPVAKRLLNIGDSVQPQDVSWVYRDTSFASDGIPTRADLKSERLAQGIRANDVIWARFLRPERAVRRGDVVQVETSGGAWEVWVSMVAERDGYVGDVINLKNPRTNATLMGKVTGQGRVELQ